MKSFHYYRDLLKMALAYRGRRTDPGYSPPRLWLELTNACNLRCVMCPQSEGRLKDFGYMSEGLFRKLIDEAAAWRPDVNLHHRGESLLHPQLPDFVKYAKQAGLYAKLHTNATLLDETKARGLIGAGLDLLSFSFDGFNARDYEATRRGADFEKVLGNITDFLKIKRSLGSPKPYTILEVIDFSPDRTVAQAARDKKDFLARLAGLPLDRLIVKRPHNWGGSYACENEETDLELPGKQDEPGPKAGQAQAGASLKPRAFSPCTFCWHALVVFWDGTVVPCPQDFYGRLKVGDVNQATLKEIFRGEPLKGLRQKMIDRNIRGLDPCSTCDMVRRRNLFGWPVASLKFLRW